MRTTITIKDETAKFALKFTGKRRLGEAIDTMVDEARQRQARLKALDVLFAEPMPHNWKKVKAARKWRS